MMGVATRDAWLKQVAVGALTTLALASVAAVARADTKYRYTITSSDVVDPLFGGAHVSGSFTNGDLASDYSADVTVTNNYNVAGDYNFTQPNQQDWVLPSQQFPGLYASLGIFEYQSVSGTYSASFTDGIIDYAGTVTLDVTTVSTVPEPATWAIMIGGLFGVGGALRGLRRRGYALASGSSCSQAA